MKNSASKQAIIPIVNGVYEEIFVIEKTLAILADGNDYRPRIDYFHDAIRMLTAGASGDPRLAVEMLAYDVAMLRHICANPMIRSKAAKNLSPSNAIAIIDDGKVIKADSQTKYRLIDAYKKYTVLFVALLAEAADDNYYSRISEANEAVENIAALENGIKNTAKKKDVAVDIEELAEQYVDDPELADKILKGFAGKKNKILAGEAVKILQEQIKNTDKKIKTIEQAHFNYATGQLAVYENSKDTVKKMAMNGLNVVGDFVENAIRQTGKGGRGF